jgi:Cof subfamily protein (haloacid dehalogenase superfamily)
MDLMLKKNRHKYRAILCDVDGTLVTNKFNGRLSKKVSESLNKVNKKVSVGIASGRALDRVTFLFKELNLQNPCIINGGAQIVHPVSRKILWEKPILSKDLKNITSIIDKLSNKVYVVDNNNEKLYSRNISIKKPISFFIPKIQERKADVIIRLLSQYHSLSLNKVVAYQKGCIALHITHAQANKHFAAQKLAEMMQFRQSDIIGVGDGFNDFPLFKACGLRVAVGNAVPELKKVADYIAPSVHDDGVADVIEKFVMPLR